MHLGYIYLCQLILFLNYNHQLTTIDAADPAEKEISDSEGENHEIPILINRGQNFTFEKNNLKKLLLNNEVRDANVCVISIAGAFRMGKSFMLNLMLRYFEKKGWKGETGDWLMKNPEDNLHRSFRWRTGSAGLTQGINAWGKPIIVKKNDGSKIAIILLDTQGNFDNKETKAKNARVFGLSTLFSSLQIINVLRQIQSNDLENLQSFVEFSKTPVANQNTDVDGNVQENRKFFQDLSFLVRDWVFSNEHGSEGGKNHLRQVRTGITNSDQESVMDYLENTFQNIGCYLMPLPSEKILFGSDDDGLRVSEIGKKFSQHVIKFFDEFINPEKLTVKTIGLSEEATGKDLFEYIKACAETILFGEGPIMISEMRAIAEFNNNKCKEETLKWYKEHLEKELRDIDLWNDYDQMIAKAKLTAKTRVFAKIWYGNKNPANKMKSLLDEPMKEIDENTSLLMREKRDRIVARKVQIWLEKSIAQVRKIYFDFPSPDNWMVELVQLDERDTQNAKKLREDALTKFVKFYDDVKERSAFNGQNILLFTTCAGAGIALGPVGPILGTAAGAAVVGGRYIWRWLSS